MLRKADGVFQLVLQRVAVDLVDFSRELVLARLLLSSSPQLLFPSLAFELPRFAFAFLLHNLVELFAVNIIIVLPIGRTRRRKRGLPPPLHALLALSLAKPFSRVLVSPPDKGFRLFRGNI